MMNLRGETSKDVSEMMRPKASPLIIIASWNSQIDPDLARSAVEAVSQWRYTPTLLNGEPIEVDTTITVNYSLAP